MEERLQQAEKVRFYIPMGEPASDSVIEQVNRRLSAISGGSTEITPDANGYWIDQSDTLVEDQIALAESVTDQWDRETLAGLAEYIKTELEQDAVMYEVEPISFALA